jgi:peptidoglycan hydrolase CwlO-like protein
MELRNDVDSLKTQIHKINVQIDDTLRENTTLRRMCDNR